MKLLLGNCLDKLLTLPDKSVHCCITSPPYWGLRDYGIEATFWPEVTFSPMAGIPPITIPEMNCVHGLETDPLSYVGHAVLIFREVKRVLRNDGTLWLDLGDSYFANPNMDNGDLKYGPGRKRIDSPNRHKVFGFKSKDLIGIPWRVAFALQADGWYLRCDIIWHKPNPMPEAVTDRPTKAHEYLFLLSKSQKYFFDQEAVKEPVTGNAHARGNGLNPKANIPTGWDASGGNHRKLQGRYNNVSRLHTPKQNESFSSLCNELVGKRNIRSVWTIEEDEYLQFLKWKSEHKSDKKDVWTIPTQGFKGAHFATFPERVVEPCIKAGTSEKGCCPECGAPWVRITEKTKSIARKVSSSHAAVPGQQPHGTFCTERHDTPSEVKTIGWQPSCNHNLNPIPCTVLDPFAGSGRSGVVANKLNRNFIGIDINPDYLKMAEKDIYEVAPLFAEASY